MGARTTPDRSPTHASGCLKRPSPPFNKHRSVAPTPKNWVGPPFFAALQGQLGIWFGLAFGTGERGRRETLRFRAFFSHHHHPPPCDLPNNNTHPHRRQLPFFPFPQHHPGVIPQHSTATMFSRAVRISRAAPIRAAAQHRAQLVPSSLAARRTVTTNAASAHVDKSTVPQVRWGSIRWRRSGEVVVGN